MARDVAMAFMRAAVFFSVSYQLAFQPTRALRRFGALGDLGTLRFLERGYTEGRKSILRAPGDLLQLRLDGACAGAA
jgi:hypothetical protein